MAYEANLKKHSLEAAADLSAKQFYAVKVDSAGKAALAGAGDRAFGILQNTPTQGQMASVAFDGISKAVAGGTIAAGAQVEVDANGKMVTASKAVVDSTVSSATDAVKGGNVIGIAMEAAVAGQIFSVMVQPSGAAPTTQL